MLSRTARARSHAALGARLGAERGGPCQVCGGLFGRLPGYVGGMERAAAGYEFATFSAGCSVPAGIVERDDQVRSEFGLRGTGGIKSDVARELGRRLARRTGARQERLRPDISLVVDSESGRCQVSSRQVVISGRYVKTARGPSQRSARCAACGGAGCAACGWHGIADDGGVEWLVSRHLFSEVGGTTASFTWVGGEDGSSLVLGSGRPFFARIRGPRRRSLRRASADLGPVRLRGLRVSGGAPAGPLRFESDAVVRVLPGGAADPAGLRALDGASVTVHEKSGRRATKSVHSLRYRRRGRHIEVRLRADGGLPIKRFVSGDGVVPGISQALGVPCTCERFDFEDVRMATIN
ncbi:putative tRNA pseudouridine synthase Pus10 [Nitrosopumilaceae archaeon]|nr:hypothetical protein [Nitrosopumilus sp.]CAI9831855.1 putative tRNA pseudouridine synthase Pus10 [Nitrosopumilaceae archaeon]MDA7941643.1 hypothetical protein [Nitrosopumilus sp.]MDA7945146.1 hypothetical protein [Nitrosopumilus sp.]MDA7955158.1 hypothetical protein [Nitrosopumilus sp.]